MNNHNVKKYKCTIKDTLNNVTYCIYSNRQLNRKQKLQQIRYFKLKQEFNKHCYDSHVNIIADE